MDLWHRPKLLAGSIAAAFLVVPIATYVVLQIIPLSFAERASLWVLAIAPGAPMIHTAASHRNVGNPELAASFQVTVALLVIVFAPLWLGVTSMLTGASYLMDPMVVLRQVSVVQLVPILVGLIIHSKWPGPAERAGKTIEKVVGIALIALILLILTVLARRIISTFSGWEFLAAALVAVSAIAAGHYLSGPDLSIRETIGNANAQRNLGLALAIVAWNLPDQKASIALMIVVYVLTALVAETIYAKMCSAKQARGQTM